MRCTACLNFCVGGLRLDSVLAIDRMVRTLVHLNDGAVHIGIMHDSMVHLRYGRVMHEDFPLPASASEARPGVAVAIIDAAVESDFRAPISLVPGILAAGVAPIPGCPKESRTGRQHPLARHPVVTIITILIIAGCPNVAVARTGRLIEDDDGGR